MKKTSTLFLQIVIVLIGITALVLLLREPHFEGVNANAGFFEVYLDPFILLVYAGSIPFFIALFQALKLLGFAREGAGAGTAAGVGATVGQNNSSVFSHAAVKSLRIIKHCALAIIGFVAAEELWIMLTHGNDDAAGAFMMGVFITFGSIVVAAAAAVFERLLQNAVDMKSENDLTV